ncbi:MAG: hypothetical protein NXY57DRAFT_985767 [Lentinula lateritia]|nr:MAG: hypothetical protein NXY57DRAFT_985767 [Lentinula lateritia]
MLVSISGSRPRAIRLTLAPLITILCRVLLQEQWSYTDPPFAPMIRNGLRSYRKPSKIMNLHQDPAFRIIQS